MGNYKLASDIDLVILGEQVNSEIVLRLHSLLNEEKSTPYFLIYWTIKVLETQN